MLWDNYLLLASRMGSQSSGSKRPCRLFCFLRSLSNYSEFWLMFSP